MTWNQLLRPRRGPTAGEVSTQVQTVSGAGIAPHAHEETVALGGDGRGKILGEDAGAVAGADGAIAVWWNYLT